VKTVRLGAFALLLLFARARTLPAQTFSVDWNRMELSSVIRLNLHEEGLRLPSGRSRAEALLEDRYPALAKSALMDIQADSSSTVGDLVIRGELSEQEAGALAVRARRVPPSLSRDLSEISAGYILNLDEISSALKRHGRPQEVSAPLLTVPAASYTGILVVADGDLPIHGRAARLPLVPCLFPKIWDSAMNLVYERNMTASSGGMVSYVSRESLRAGGPSGLDPRLVERVGENPFKIMAAGVYGIVPTDPVIDREDALVILSNPANHRLLHEGRVALVLNPQSLRVELP
jgi:hypothetical protein